MKIILITASFEDEQRSPEIQDNAIYPIGLGYMHSFLESKGHNVTTLSLNDYNPEECKSVLIRNIDNINPDVVGFSVLTANRVCSFNLIDYLNINYPNIKIVAGGIHVTVMYDQILNKYPFLIAVLGEGEITFSELLDNKKPLEDIDGVAFVNNGKIIKTKERALIENLDILPYPKHEIFFNSIRRCGCILTTRGCPFSCTFCCLCSVSRRRVRYRSIDNVINEIEYMINKFPEMSSVFIHDDSFFLNNNKVIEFCNEIIKRKMKIEFICSGRLKPISQKMVDIMKEAGFTHILFGLESGAKEILKTSKKGITKEDAIKAVSLFVNSPIRITLFLIVGLPGENLETVKETIDLVQTIQKIKYVWMDDFNILFLYPGTEVYEIAKNKGFIDDNYWLSDKCIPIYTAEHSIETLIEYKELMLNSLSLSRIMTSVGFSAQKKMIPLIFKDEYFRRKLIKLFSDFIITPKTFNKFKKFVGLDRKTRKARMAFIKKTFSLTSYLS